jgi:hypothetical protein
MAQGSSGAAILSNKVSFADTPSIDSFSRLRVANPTFLFDAQFTYGLEPLLYEQITNGSGATVTHDATNRMALMTFSSTPTGGKAYMQSYEWIPYQPGRCQLFFLTFNMVAAVANVLKFVGIGDDANGIRYELDGTTRQFKIYSDTTLGDEAVVQANWNLDKLDGTGPSGITLADDKTNILVIDFQALYVGRVRIGFDIDGQVVFAHEFLHANASAHPYIQTASLPIRAGMTCTGTVSTTMNFICASAISEGGAADPVGYQFVQEGSGSAGNDARAHILSIRPKTTFNSIVNRVAPQVEAVELLVTGNNPVYWELVIGQAITGAAYADVNASHSGMEYSGGTISGSPALVIASGYVSASATAKGAGLEKVRHRIPITLDAAGAVRANGTLSLLATGIGAASACRGAISWTERR